jgi:hypothetical protein
MITNIIVVTTKIMQHVIKSLTPLIKADIPSWIRGKLKNRAILCTHWQRITWKDELTPFNIVRERCLQFHNDINHSVQQRTNNNFSVINCSSLSSRNQIHDTCFVGWFVIGSDKYKKGTPIGSDERLRTSYEWFMCTQLRYLTTDESRCRQFTFPSP